MSQPIPNVPINFVPAKTGDVLSLVPSTPIITRMRPSGLNLLVDNRIDAAELTIPPRTLGPPLHWHEMHDETFLVTPGTVRFHRHGSDDLDAKTGDYVVVGVRAPHTFSNPFDVEARFFNTFTPAFYINYFKLLSQLADEGKPLSPGINRQAMASFATLPVKK
ncbi:hypothetical protein B0A49_03263 [Cryomyces minteri]|uniref:Cupin type-2 domain-containing protein n=1 Tax=Cryomyces minteri TaxID=331657 RepID=A0A4V5NGG4_9PEZI|nr:hypothetical protein B0A49_03263 [Cryomyces minteri]